MGPRARGGSPTPHGDPPLPVGGWALGVGALPLWCGGGWWALVGWVSPLLKWKVYW